MALSKRGVMEFMVRDFAERYLKMEEPFTLREVAENPNYPDDFEDPSYTLSDIKNCMMQLGMYGIGMDKWIDKPYTESKVLFSVSKVSTDDDTGDALISIRDLIYSCDDKGSEIRICKKCGRLFMYNTKLDPDFYDDNSLCHYIDKDHPLSCYDKNELKSRTTNINHLIKSFSYYSNRLFSNIQYGSFTKEEYDKWISKGLDKINKVISGEMSDEEFLRWVPKKYEEYLKSK